MVGCGGETQDASRCWEDRGHQTRAFIGLFMTLLYFPFALRLSGLGGDMRKVRARNLLTWRGDFAYHMVGFNHTWSWQTTVYVRSLVCFGFLRTVVTTGLASVATNLAQASMLMISSILYISFIIYLQPYFVPYRNQMLLAALALVLQTDITAVASASTSPNEDIPNSILFYLFLPITILSFWYLLPVLKSLRR